MAADKKKKGICQLCGEEKILFYNRCEDCRAFFGNAERARLPYDRKKKKVKISSGTDITYMHFPEKSINEVNKEAMANGMSYGQWQALQYMKAQKEAE